MPAAARTTSIASSMMAVGARSVGLQKGVRWKPIRTGVFYPVPPQTAGDARRKPSMTTLEELLRTRVARFVDRLPDWDAFADARVEGYRRAPPPDLRARAPRQSGARGRSPPPVTPSVLFLPPGPGHPPPPHQGEEGVLLLHRQ